MIQKHKILLAAVFILLLPVVAKAEAGAQSPARFIEEVYAHYQPGQPAFEPMGKDGETLFDHGLFLLLQQDQMDANVKNEVPWINGDPICNCQEYKKLEVIKITVPETDNPHPVASVSFTNQGKTENMQFELVPSGDTWRIYDISTSDIGSLRAYLTEGLAENKKE